MNAGWSFSGVVVVVVDKGQDGDVGGMYVDCLVWVPVHGKQEISFVQQDTAMGIEVPEL